MPDGQPFAIATPTARHAERRSPATGLPIAPNNKLTSTDRDGLRVLERRSRLFADHLAEAIAQNRVDAALEACGAAAELATESVRVAAAIAQTK